MAENGDFSPQDIGHLEKEIALTLVPAAERDACELQQLGARDPAPAGVLPTAAVVVGVREARRGVGGA